MFTVTNVHKLYGPARIKRICLRMLNVCFEQDFVRCVNITSSVVTGLCFRVVRLCDRANFYFSLTHDVC